MSKYKQRSEEVKAAEKLRYEQDKAANSMARAIAKQTATRRKTAYNIAMWQKQKKRGKRIRANMKNNPQLHRNRLLRYSHCLPATGVIAQRAEALEGVE